MDDRETPGRSSDGRSSTAAGGAAAPFEEREYRPQGHAGWGPSAWAEMFRELWRSRELAWILIVRDFKARHKQTFLSYGWTLITPVVAVATFVVLSQSKVVNIGDVGVPYPLYALIGLTTWQVFAGGLVHCSNSMVAGGSMVMKVNFPKEALVLAAMGQTVIDFGVRLLLIVSLLAWYRLFPPWEAVFFPLAVLPIVVFTLAVGLLLSLANAVFRDVSNIVALLATFLMFLTPVLYPARGELARMNTLNPLAAMVTAPRDLILFGTLSDPGRFVWTSVLALVALLASWRIFHLAEVRIAERIGAR